MSLLDHLPLGANVDGSGSSTQAEGRTQLDTFTILAAVLARKDATRQLRRELEQRAYKKLGSPVPGGLGKVCTQ